MYRRKDQLQDQQQKIFINWLYSRYYETPNEEIGFFRQLEYIDDQSPDLYAHIGGAYIALQQYKNAIPACEKVFKIYKKWKLKPLFIGEYTQLGYVYHKTGQYKKEKKLYKKAEKDFPINPEVPFRQAILALSERDTIEANKYIKKLISIGKDNSWSEARVAMTMGNLYSQAEYMDKAEGYYRKALTLEPFGSLRSNRLNTLAYFLIDKNIKITEGMELVDKALEFNPANYVFLDTKGWGLYKQGKYQEALKFLQRSDSLKPIYNHEVFLHLEAVKKAVVMQK